MANESTIKEALTKYLDENLVSKLALSSFLRQTGFLIRFLRFPNFSCINQNTFRFKSSGSVKTSKKRCSASSKKEYESHVLFKSWQLHFIQSVSTIENYLWPLVLTSHIRKCA